MTKEDTFLLKNKPLDYETLGELSLQLSSLLKCGIQLVQAFEIILKNDRIKPSHSKIYTEVVDNICSGMTFSEAMKASNGYFPDIMINVISAAEYTGNMSVAISELAEYFNRQCKMKKKIENAVAYPKLLCLILAAVISVLTVFVVPKIHEMFSSQEQLPFATEMLFAISKILKENLILIIASVIYFFVLIKTLLKTEKLKTATDKLIIKMPFIGKIYRTVYTARFADTFSSLHISGVSIITSIEVSRCTIGNTYIESQFDLVKDKISSGTSVSDAVSVVDGLDKKLSDVIRIGEESGDLENMLTSISEKLNMDAENAISKALTFIEPMFIIVIALVVLFVIMAVMVPILDSYSLLENNMGI